MTSATQAGKPGGASGETGELKQGMSLTGMLILGIGGTIGTGALFSGVGMAAVAGPAMIVAWIVGAIIYAFIGITYIDLSVRFPEAGGPSRYALYTHGHVANLVNSVGSLIWYLFVPPIEALATVEGLAHFDAGLLKANGDPTTAGALVAVGLTLVFVPFNYYGIQAFTRFTNVLGGAKILLYVLLAAGVAIALTHGGNFSHFGGFAPFGFGGVLAAVPLAMFAFGGIRVLPDFAEEVTDSRHLKISIIVSIVGQSLIYVLFGVAFIGAIDWKKLSVATGSWASLSKVAGNPFILLTNHNDVAWLLALAIVVGILGPFVDGYVYQGAGSRVLLAMGRSGYVSRRMKEVSATRGIPVGALLAITAVGAVISFLAAPVPSIYSLINDSVVAGYIAFAAVPVAMLALRRQKGERLSVPTAVVGALAFGGASLIVYWSGWPSVPYAVILSAVGVIGFGLFSRATGFTHAIWYVVWVLFLTAMTYIGSVGKGTEISFDFGTAIVAVVSIVVFLPWGLASRLPALGAIDATDPKGVPVVRAGAGR